MRAHDRERDQYVREEMNRLTARKNQSHQNYDNVKNYDKYTPSYVNDYEAHQNLYTAKGGATGGPGHGDQLSRSRSPHNETIRSYHSVRFAPDTSIQNDSKYSPDAARQIR